MSMGPSVRSTSHRTQGGRSYGVVHLGSRTHYQVSTALAERNKLAALYTDFYSPEWLMRVRGRLPGSLPENLDRRHTARVSSRHVRSLRPMRSIATRALSKLGSTYEPYVAGMDWALGRAAGRVATQVDRGWVVYSLYWPGFVSTAPLPSSTSSPRILFKEHPSPSQVISILREHRDRLGDVSDPDPEELMNPESIAQYEHSLAAADAIVVPCSFVARGLFDLGISESKISIVPLGSGRSGLEPVGGAENCRPRNKIRLLWVGRPLFRKGFQDLLAALSLLPSGLAELTVVFPSSEIKAPSGLIPEGTRVLCRLTPSQLADEFASHDLLVMPSLVEGFGMVYLEALSFGTPIICTSNTGAADLITDGQEGFIVEPGAPATVAACVVALADDRDRLDEMRTAAKSCAARWTWNRFRSSLVEAIESRETVA